MVQAVALNLVYGPGQTPLDADEAAQLIPRHITTQGALDEWEQVNIQRAVQWTGRQRNPKVLTEDFCRELHRRMFDRTWRWAGRFRRSDKNIGCQWEQVPMRLRQLLDNTAYQLGERVFPVDEAVTRFHHQLVLVHPFPNGNGRHSRLMTDCLLRQNGTAAFSWGGRQTLVAAEEIRQRYIAALRAADAGDIGPLMAFMRS
jgi:Fic-DOC domain mobile mystery protein B